MKAIILAAGYGSRLRPLTDHTPKTMVEVAGERIIDRVLHSLVLAEVTEILVVLGYRGAVLREHLTNTYAPKISFTFVENADYATTNNIHSFALALEHIDDDFILIESDVLYDENMIRDLVAFPWPNAAAAARYRTGMDGTVLSVGEDGFVEGVFPTAAQGPKFDFSHKYKTINVYKFSREFLREKLRATSRFYAQTHGNSYYEIVLGVIIYLRSAQIRMFDMSDREWAEIDDMNDLEKADYVFRPDRRLEILNSSHGGYWAFDVLDFCYIRNMYFPTPAVWGDLRFNMQKVLACYGSSQRLLNRKMGYFLLASEEHCCVLNGAAQGIRLLPELLGNPRVAIFAPTFDEYLSVFPRADRLDAGRHSLTDFVTSAQKTGAGAVVLVNPNSPTGRTYPRAEVIGFLDAAAAAGPAVVVDESFLDFAGDGCESVSDYLIANRIPRVLLIKSLSKSLGVPGLRLGYCISGDRSLIDQLNRLIPIWNSNSLAQYFLELLLKYRPEISSSFQRTMLDREELRRELALIDGVEPYPSGGNFVMCRLAGATGSATELTRRLIARGIYIKDCTAKFEGRGEYVRIAVRTPEDHQRLLAEFIACAPGLAGSGN